MAKSRQEKSDEHKNRDLSIGNLTAENLPTLRAAFQAVPGVAKIDFNLERSGAVLEFDPALAHIDDFLRAVLKAGFQVVYHCLDSKLSDWHIPPANRKGAATLGTSTSQATQKR